MIIEKSVDPKETEEKRVLAIVNKLSKEWDLDEQKFAIIALMKDFQEKTDDDKLFYIIDQFTNHIRY